MKKIEALERVEGAAAIGSAIMARQIDMGDFKYLSGTVEPFYILAGASAVAVVISELIRRKENSNPKNNS